MAVPSVNATDGSLSGPPGTTSRGGDPAPRWLRPVLVGNLVVEIGIVLTGGLVRLTGSGLGCPTWPECVPGSFTPVVTQEEGYHKYIEFGNRTLTSVVGIVALAALVGVVLALRRRRAVRGPVPEDRRLLLLGAAPLLGVFAQVVLGGITVLTDLHPATVAAHFMVSMVIVAASTWLLLELPRGRPGALPGPTVRPEVRWLVAGVCLVAAVVLVLGTVVTGSGPHSGDADQPARFGLDPRTMSWLHADAVWLFVGLVVGLALALRLTGAPARARARSLMLLVVTLGQGAIGFVQYALDLPVALVAAHMLGASLLVVAVTATAHATLTPPAPDVG